ncbi:MAG: hypothetical protein WBV82_32505 [Myxococcaceae bacterium]
MHRARAVALIWLLPASALAGKATLYLEERANLSPRSAAAVKTAAIEAVRRAGHTPIDVAPVADPLFRPGMLVPEFSGPPPKAWPEALRTVWETGQRGCREDIEKQKGARRAQTSAEVAVRCQMQLARLFYNRYLDHLAPDHILEVGIAKTSTEPNAPVRITVVQYGLTGNEGRRAVRDVPRSEMEKVIPELLTDVLEGRAQRIPLNRTRELPGQSAAPRGK